MNINELVNRSDRLEPEEVQWVQADGELTEAAVHRLAAEVEKAGKLDGKDFVRQVRQTLAWLLGARTRTPLIAAGDPRELFGRLTHGRVVEQMVTGGLGMVGQAALQSNPVVGIAMMSAAIRKYHLAMVLRPLVGDAVATSRKLEALKDFSLGLSAVLLGPAAIPLLSVNWFAETALPALTALRLEVDQDVRGPDPRYIATATDLARQLNGAAVSKQLQRIAQIAGNLHDVIHYSAAGVAEDQVPYRVRVALGEAAQNLLADPETEILARETGYPDADAFVAALIEALAPNLVNELSKAKKRAFEADVYDVEGAVARLSGVNASDGFEERAEGKKKKLGEG